MNNLVYKFLPLERLSYLDDELLRITQPIDLNDPFECLPQTPSIDDFIFVLEERKKEHLDKINNGKYSKHQRIEMRNKIIRVFKSEITKIKKNSPINLKSFFSEQATEKINSAFGILSLTRRWDSSLMWSHYSSSHKGFCIGFDIQNPFFNAYRKLKNASKIFMPVLYSDTRIKVPLVKGEKIDPMLTLTKSRDWEYEEEERLLVFLSEANKKIETKPYDIYLYRVPHSLIKEIIIGVHFPSTHIKQISEFCSTRNIKLFKSQISETKFDMIRTEVEI